MNIEEFCKQLESKLGSFSLSERRRAVEYFKALLTRAVRLGSDEGSAVSELGGVDGAISMIQSSFEYANKNGELIIKAEDGIINESEDNRLIDGFLQTINAKLFSDEIKIFIDLELDDVRIMPSGDGLIHFKVFNRLVDEYNVIAKNDRLDISRNKRAGCAVYNYIMGERRPMAELWLPTPKTYHIECFSVGGNVAVYSLNAEDITIKNCGGECELKRLKCDKATIATDGGNINIASSRCRVFTASTASGDYRIFSSVLGAANIASKFGDMGIAGLNAARAKIVSLSGNITIEESSLKMAEIKNTSGDILFRNNQVAVDCNIKTVSGNVNIVTNGESDCSYNCEAVAGSVEGEVVKGYGSGDVNIVSTCGDITFEKE